jgi:Protein of unknown function (DUF3014)
MENKRSWTPIAVAVVVVAAAGVGYWYLKRPQAPPPPPAQPQAQAPRPADAPLPPPEKSDAQMRKDLASLSSMPEWARWLGVSDLLDRFVVFVDNVAEDVSPRKQLDFISVQPQKSERLDTSRYDRIVAVIASVDAKGAAQVVRDMHPLLESAYRKLGYPDRKFDQVAAKALQRIIDAPVVEKPPRLVPKGANNFGFEEEKLEAQGPVEKLLVRMGPRNTRILQDKARELAAALDLRVARH